MFESVVTALLRAVLDETSVDVQLHESEKRTPVASKILETAPKGEMCAEKLNAAGRRVILPPPSMWN